MFTINTVELPVKHNDYKQIDQFILSDFWFDN